MNPFPVAHWGGEETFAASPSFFAPLINTLVPTTALGSATATYSVSGGVGSVLDWEGIIRKTKAGEARFMGARRVENMLAKSEAFNDAAWTKATITVGTGVADPLAGTSAFTLTATAGGAVIYQGFAVSPASSVVSTASCWVRRRTGTGIIRMYARGGADPGIDMTLTSSWQRFATTGTTLAAATTRYFMLEIVTNADAIDVWHPLFENVSGQGNQNPSEYISTGVLSAPWHGAGADSVKYYSTKNGNTVASNVVTEAVGAAITSASGGSAMATDATGPLGFISEYAATSLVTWTAEILTNWTLTGATSPSGNAVATPAGYASLNSITEDASSGTHSADKTAITVGATANVCFLSIFVKPATRPALAIRFHDGTHGVQIDLENLTTTPVIASYAEIGTAFTLGSSGLIAYPNGWYRVWCTFTKNGSTSFNWQNWPRATNGGSVSYTGTNGQIAVYVWGPMIIQGIPAVYLPNWLPNSGSRGADDLSYSFATNASATVGTTYAEVQTLWTAGMSYSAPVVAFGTSPNFPLYNSNEASTIIRTGDGTNNVQKTISDMNTAVRKIAASWTGTTLLVTGGGATAASGTFDGNMGSTEIAVGGPSTFTGNNWTGSIRNVKCYTIAATAGQLATLTT